MRRGLRRPLVVLTAMAMLVAVWTLPVGAKNDGNQGHRMTVSGDSTPINTCDLPEGSVGAIELSGDLDGCLSFFPEDYQCDTMNGFDRYREQGTELFVGEYGGEGGEFTTKYTLEATYASGSCADIDANWAGELVDFPFDKQLTGGCDHHIKGSSGVFQGARGLITFHDFIPNPGVSGANNFFYSGKLRLSGTNR